MSQKDTFVLGACLVSVLGALSACSAAPDSETTGEAQQALTCTGASCDGLLPANTQCKFDMQDTGIGAQVFDANHSPIGGIGLFYSPSCQTVWAASAFYVAGGPRNFRICTVRKRVTENDPSCVDYVGSFGNDAPMKYVPAGKSAFGKITVDGITTRTADYTAH